VTPTASPTPTATPSGSATPICTPNIYLATSPAGTLAFGDVAVGNSVTLPLTVKNNEPAGTLKLTAAVQTPKDGFKVTGGTCVNSSLTAGGSCNYQVRLTGANGNQGAVSAPLVITGTFPQNVCPGHTQSVTVTLAGNVTP
jgi:hypothetical protein